MPITQAEPPGERPIFARLAEYESYLNDKGCTRKHVRDTVRVILRCIIACRLDTPNDLARFDRIRTWLSDERKRCNHASRTVNSHTTTLRSFARWLMCEGITDRNPLLALHYGNANVDRRRIRRAGTAAEILAVINATRDSGITVRRLSGPDRAMLYATAVLTGLRAGELASLTRANLDLDAETPTITIRAAQSKHRREDHLPLHRDLVTQLKAWLVGRGCERLWVGAWYRHAGAMLRDDLALAHVPYRDSLGRYLDFHALRHTFITNLARAGVHPRVAMTLARHASVAITMNVYTHVDMSEARDALGKLTATLP